MRKENNYFQVKYRFGQMYPDCCWQLKSTKSLKSVKMWFGTTSWRFTGMFGVVRLHWLIFWYKMLLVVDVDDCPALPIFESQQEASQTETKARLRWQPTKVGIIFCVVAMLRIIIRFKLVVYPGWMISIGHPEPGTCKRKKEGSGTCCKRFRFHGNLNPLKIQNIEDPSSQDCSLIPFKHCKYIST